MNENFSTPKLNRITTLVESPNTAVELVLDDEGINLALRNGIQAVLNFLIGDIKNLMRLTDFALTNVLPPTKIPSKTVNSSVMVLTFSSSGKIMNMLRQSESFIERIDGFPKTEFASDCRSCGNYGKIIEALAKFSCGTFLTECQSIKPFLTEKMVNMGMRDLFVNLCRNFSEAFGVSQELFMAMVSKVTKETAFFVVTGIAEVLKTKNDLMKMVANEQFMRALLKVAKNENNIKITRIEAFMLFEYIGKKCTPDILTFLAEESDSFDFTSIQSDALLAAALRVLRTKNDTILSRILEEKLPLFLGFGIITSIDALPNDGLLEFVKKHELDSGLIHCFEKYTVKTIIREAIELLIRKNIITDENFSCFINNTLKAYDNKCNCQYGGSVPRNDDSDLSDDEPQKMDYDDSIPVPQCSEEHEMDESPHKKGIYKENSDLGGQEFKEASLHSAPDNELKVIKKEDSEKKFFKYPLYDDDDEDDNPLPAPSPFEIGDIDQGEEEDEDY